MLITVFTCVFLFCLVLCAVLMLTFMSNKDIYIPFRSVPDFTVSPLPYYKYSVLWALLPIEYLMSVVAAVYMKIVYNLRRSFKE